MTRSIWKGPFVDNSLIKKAEKLSQSGRKEVLKVTSYTEEEFKLPKEVTTIVVAGSRRIQGSPFNNYEVVKEVNYPTIKGVIDINNKYIKIQDDEPFISIYPGWESNIKKIILSNDEIIEL